MIQDHVFTFRDSTDEKFIPIYQIISKDNIESAGLTECELSLLKAFTKEYTSLFIVKVKMLKVCCYNQQVSDQVKTKTVTECAYYLGI